MATDVRTRRSPARVPWTALRRFGTHAVLAVLVSVLASPLLFVALVSTQSLAQVQDPSFIAPGTSAPHNYAVALTEYGMARDVLNSLVMATVVVTAKLALSMLAALALVYYRFRYRSAVFAFVLLTLLFPVPVRIVPLFEAVAKAGLTNTLVGLAGPFVASATSVFFLRQHFRSLPASLAEVAALDGVGPIRFLVSVLLPMSRGPLAGIAIIEFISTWNKYLWPLIVVDDNAKQVAQVGLKYLLGAGTGQTNWGVVMAGAVVTLLPPLVLLLAFRTHVLATFGLNET